MKGAGTRTARDSGRQGRAARLEAGARHAERKVFAAANATALVEAIVKPFDRICVEGDNQKHADFLMAGGVTRRYGMIFRCRSSAKRSKKESSVGW